jgi:hypothetical protein
MKEQVDYSLINVNSLSRGGSYLLIFSRQATIFMCIEKTEINSKITQNLKQSIHNTSNAQFINLQVRVILCVCIYKT